MMVFFHGKGSNFAVKNFSKQLAVWHSSKAYRTVGRHVAILMSLSEIKIKCPSRDAAGGAFIVMQFVWEVFSGPLTRKIL